MSSSASPSPSAWRPGVVAAVLAGILVLLCLLRWPLPQRPIHDVDESVSALIAIDWLEGGVPYKDSIDQRGPLTYLLYAATFLVAGKGNMLAVHGALLLLVFAGCALLLRFGAILGGALGFGRPRGESEGVDPASGYLAAFFLAIVSFTYRRSQMLAFHTEWPVVVLSTLGMVLLWRGLSRNDTRWRLPLAGSLFALAFLSKQPAVFDGLASGLFLFAWQWKEGRLASRETLARAAGLAGGFFVTLGAVLAYFAAHGALADLYLYFWSYNVEHYTAVIPVAERLAGLNPFHFRRHLLTANPLLLAVAAFALARAALALARPQPASEGHAGGGRRAVDARLLLVLWFLGAYFGASYSGRNFGHYFIQVLAPASLLLALLVREAWLRAPALAGARAAAARALLVLVVAAGLAQPLYRFRRDIAVLSLDRPGPRRPPQARLLSYLAARTQPADRIFVWGYNPEIYLLSDRRPASRYTNTNYLTGMLPWENSEPDVDTSAHIVPGAMDILLRELEASHALLVIDSVPGNHRFYAKYPLAKFPPLAAYLAAHYQRVDRIRGQDGKPYYDVYRRLGS